MGPARARSRAQAQGPGPHFLNIGPGGRASGLLHELQNPNLQCRISNDWLAKLGLSKRKSVYPLRMQSFLAGGP